VPMHLHNHGGETKAADGGPSLPMPDVTSSELRFLEPAAAQFRRDGARLQFREKDDSEWGDVSLIRLFPLSEPEHWLALIAKDGTEIGVLRSLADLPAEPLRLARDELRRRYLVPQIECILACRVRDEVVEWTVRTDRGRGKFLTRNLREQVKEPLPSRLTLIDVEGNRYDIPNVLALDPDSRRRLEAQL
jgi:hypothetical protein